MCSYGLSQKLSKKRLAPKHTAVRIAEQWWWSNLYGLFFCHCYWQLRHDASVCFKQSYWPWYQLLCTSVHLPKKPHAGVLCWQLQWVNLLNCLILGKKYLVFFIRKVAYFFYSNFTSILRWIKWKIGLRCCAILSIILLDSAKFCKILQDSARFCKILQDSARFCKIL